MGEDNDELQLENMQEKGERHPTFWTRLWPILAASLTSGFLTFVGVEYSNHNHSLVYETQSTAIQQSQQKLIDQLISLVRNDHDDINTLIYNQGVTQIYLSADHEKATGKQIPSSVYKNYSSQK